MTLSQKAVALAVCSAAITTAGAAAVGIEKKAKANKLTARQLDFERLLRDSTEDAWFRANLRCSKITFQRLVNLLASTSSGGFTPTRRACDPTIGCNHRKGGGSARKLIQGVCICHIFFAAAKIFSPQERL
ncbi:hypothetical protein PF005_g5872 [Phytophthora fragariae]|uniref:RxLR effector protein n=1 Tax=Phytophthora fragariae TaxID=53985 RepID=A0A6A3SJ70_9STRA|nr:hypothetical protein PF003_g19360 [Phytophthora fragariae]KAE8943899.1 hypothetical protein PF009_g6394 [Phytophthora fragariae]KAE9014662.1 hypothetical protein PF011_g7957 [Phytophthora fragariae]KAE9117952.1 hypothetical protein PF007_g9104 [Phytophthora fragariae]KAE9128191.1 hypothetical protein PF010_g4604 [Phytophthora fragariae]